MKSVSVSFLFSPWQTALTLDNVLEELKLLTWWILRDVLQLPHSQRDKIENKYPGEAERKREGVKYWLWNHPYASWRLLITQLDLWKLYETADQIRGYAEKSSGKLSSSMY